MKKNLVEGIAEDSEKYTDDQLKERLKSIKTEKSAPMLRNYASQLMTRILKGKAHQAYHDGLEAVLENKHTDHSTALDVLNELEHLSIPNHVMGEGDWFKKLITIVEENSALNKNPTIKEWIESFESDPDDETIEEKHSSKAARIAALVLAKMEFKRVKDLSEEYSNQWLEAQVTEVKPSAYGKGTDLVVKLTEDYPGLPPIIKTDMLKLDYHLENKDKVKIKLHISPGGILVDQLTMPGASKEKKVAAVTYMHDVVNMVADMFPGTKFSDIDAWDSSEFKIKFPIKGVDIYINSTVKPHSLKVNVNANWGNAKEETWENISDLKKILNSKTLLDKEEGKKSAAPLKEMDEESVEKDLAGKLLVNMKKKIDTNLTKAKIELIKILDGKEFQEGAIREFYKSCMEAIKLLDSKGYEHWHE